MVVSLDAVFSSLVWLSEAVSSAVASLSRVSQDVAQAEKEMVKKETTLSKYVYLLNTQYSMLQ